jgi:predicted XRE-type DNA-binding protein
MSATNEMDYTESSGNVFADLGIADPDEAPAKAELARQIGVIVAERKLTQIRAAELLGIDQPSISALMRGHLTGFSIDRLLHFLLVLDRDVEIVIKPRAGSDGRVNVVAVA